MSRNEAEKYERLISVCDSLIKAGQLGAASKMLGELSLAKIPRSQRLPLAKICRRAGLVAQGLRLLFPLIRQEKNVAPPTASETCEYALLLSRNGSTKDALALLNEVNPVQAPEALLYRSFIHIGSWDYAEAAPILESYSKSCPDVYTKLVAMVNLASALIWENQLDRAEALLRENIDLAEQAGAQRLLANCHEQRGMVYVIRGDFERARGSLQLAQGILAASQSFDQIFVQQWMSVIEAIETNSVEPLVRLRTEAQKRKFWEAVREADLYILKLRFDQKLYDHLLIGTPWEAYRSRIRRQIEREPSESCWLGKERGHWIDLETGKTNGANGLREGSKSHQVLSALSRDFYAPSTVGFLFAEIYPSEYFNIHTSPNRVHQAIRRTREWLEENDFRASIEQSHGTYRLVLDENHGIKVPLTNESSELFEKKVADLRRIFPATEFDARKACESLNLTRTAFHRFARWALEEGIISRSGSARATRYRLCPETESAGLKRAS